MTEEPVTFYHGTRAGYRGAGGLVLPRNKSGQKGKTSAPLKPGRQDRSDAGDWVYVTTSKTLAWVYAWYAPGRGKPKVLTVAPAGYVYPDPEHSEEMHAYRCEAAFVRKVDTDPEISEEDARAGWMENDDR